MCQSAPRNSVEHYYALFPPVLVKATVPRFFWKLLSLCLIMKLYVCELFLKTDVFSRNKWAWLPSRNYMYILLIFNRKCNSICIMQTLFFNIKNTKYGIKLTILKLSDKIIVFTHLPQI